MAYRLRYRAHDLELPIGEFTIGRGAECQLSLDDPLVSRRHAVLHIRKDGVSIEDLNSRNGVTVNGAKLDGHRDLRDGDRFGIGGQEMSIYAGDEGAAGKQHEAYRRHTQTLGLGQEDLRAELVAQNLQSGSEPTAQVRGPQSFALLGAVADKAFAMGRADEAERILQSLLSEILARAGDRKHADLGLVETASRYAIRLAIGTGKPLWIDYVFSVYGSLRRPAPATVIDDLLQNARKVKGLDPKGIRAYLAILKEDLTSFGPAERFLFQRIEGLERQIGV